MNKIRKISIIIISILSSFLLTSCWNYREINDVDIILGTGIDWNNYKKEYIMTFETHSASDKKNGKTPSKLVQHKGKSIFKTVRNYIEKNGKPGYWSHTKVLILGKNMAENGIISLLDYTTRDAEFRSDMKILVSSENTAADIFLKKEDKSEITSIKLEKSLDNQDKIGTYKKVFFWDFSKKLSTEGYEAVTPLVFYDNNNKRTTRISGLAVFKKDKMIGKLNNDEALYYLFIDDDIKNEVLVVNENFNHENMDISLEILNNKTKIEPLLKDDRISFKINTKTEMNVAEINGTTDILEEKARKKLTKDIEKTLEKNIKNLVNKVQTNYNSDIFGFGNSIKKNMPNEWKKIGSQWDKYFPTLNIEVNSEVNITKSALLSKPHKIEK